MRPQRPVFVLRRALCRSLSARCVMGQRVITVPNPHFPSDDDALALAATTVRVVGDITPALVQQAAQLGASA